MEAFKLLPCNLLARSSTSRQQTKGTRATKYRLSTELRRFERCELSAVPGSSVGGINGVRPPDLPHHRAHIGEVPNLGEPAVFDARRVSVSWLFSLH
jgi:hypothetical protein